MKDNLSVVYGPNGMTAHDSQVRYAQDLSAEIGRAFSEYTEALWSQYVEPLKSRSIRFGVIEIADMAAFHRDRARVEEDVMRLLDAEFVCFLLDLRGKPVTLLLNCRLGQLVHRLDESSWTSTS